MLCFSFLGFVGYLNNSLFEKFPQKDVLVNTTSSHLRNWRQQRHGQEVALNRGSRGEGGGLAVCVRRGRACF
jgi:hypothetical protein